MLPHTFQPSLEGGRQAAVTYVKEQYRLWQQEEVGEAWGLHILYGGGGGRKQGGGEMKTADGSSPFSSSHCVPERWFGDVARALCGLLVERVELRWPAGRQRSKDTTKPHPCSLTESMAIPA